MELASAVRMAAAAIFAARVLVITAGAGMGVDSGLPDFRGRQGFWQACPSYERLGGIAPTCVGSPCLMLDSKTSMNRSFAYRCVPLSSPPMWTASFSWPVSMKSASCKALCPVQALSTSRIM